MSAGSPLDELLAQAAAAWPGVAVARADFLAYLAERLPPDRPLEEVAEVAAAGQPLPGLRVRPVGAGGDRGVRRCVPRRGRPRLRPHSPGRAHSRRRAPGRAPEAVRRHRRARAAHSRLRGARPITRVGADDRDPDAHRPGARAWGPGARCAARRCAGVRWDRERYAGPALLVGQCRAELRPAFEEAVAELTPRQRNLLRQHFLHSLSIDQLAGLYGAHRSTCARWLDAAREKLVRGTRRRLASRLGVAPGELEEIMQLVASRLDITFRRVLGDRMSAG